MNIDLLKMKIKMGAGFIMQPVIKFLTQPEQRGTTYYSMYYKYRPLKKKAVLYEAFSGRGMLCSPYALFQELIRHPVYGSYEHIWVLDKMQDHQKLIHRYQKMYPNVTFVQLGSRKYLKYLATAKYLINNVTFESYFVKRPGQVYICTWHGIPLKHIGYDVPQGALAASNMARNFLHADYMISANPFLTQIYKEAFRQGGLSPVKIIEEGYPRLDLLVNTKREDIYEKLHQAGVDVRTDKKIILYAPTWKGGSTADPDCSLDGFLKLKTELEQVIDTDAYQILVKVHQAVYIKIKEKLADFSYVVPAVIDANEILGITDLLISDYSSIYFDFLATGRPVLFYITDLEQYEKQRGMYFGMDELPAPYTDNLKVLGSWINQIDSVFEQNKERYSRVRDWCCQYETGAISKKIVRAVFDGQTDGVRMIECGKHKKKLLISRGNMLVNGISTALANLLNEIDYEKYDVTVLVEPSRDRVQKELIMHLNPKARVIVRPGAMPRTVSEEIRNHFYTQANPIRGLRKVIFPRKAYEREFRRLFGEAVFDYIIDYEGFSSFFATICLMQKNAKTCIWMHSDMRSEYRTRFHWLERIFALYPQFDYLVSSSRQLMEVNRDNFSKYVPPEKFKYAKNCVDFASVHAGSREGKIIRRQDEYYYTLLSESDFLTNMKLIPLQPGRFDLSEDKNMELCSCTEAVKNGVIRFVTVGRLSVEKNQAQLVRAFARLAAEQPEIMLFIIGHGPEKEKLKQLIAQLHMQERIILTGRMSNPFGLMRQCDCFVLPSLYEGQPLVVFEARALHMPIILSDYATIEGSVVTKGQYIVHKEADSIYEGLRAYLLGKVPDDYVFMDEEYNREAYAEFEQAVFGESRMLSRIDE